MSPSKRAGDTVDSVDEGQAPANGNTSEAGNGNGSGAHNGSSYPDGQATRARPRRRSVVSSGSVTQPERGTTSQRGPSSSSITRRSAGRFPEDDGPYDDDSDESPAAATGAADSDLATEPVAAPLEPPTAMPPPTARVDPHERRTSPEPAVVPAPLPVTAPATSPEREREPATLRLTDDVAPPPDSSYTRTMTAHDIAPVPRVLGRRPRVRRVTRVVRHVDPWSVFKIAIVFNLVLYGVLLTAGVLLWNVAHATGTVDNLERFFESFGWSEFEFDGGAIYHASWIAGLFAVIGLTGAMVLAATLFNLITDLVGGVRLTVLEEEVVERTAAPMRRFVVRRPTNPADPSAGLRREVDRLPVRPDDDGDDSPV